MKKANSKKIIIGQPIDKSRVKRIKSKWNNLVKINGERVCLWGRCQWGCDGISFFGIMAKTGEQVEINTTTDIDEYGEINYYFMDFFNEFENLVSFHAGDKKKFPFKQRVLELEGKKRTFTKKQLKAVDALK